MSELLKFSYDEKHDILTVEGMQYSGEIFRQWARGGLPVGRIFRIVERFFHRKDECVLTIQIYHPDAYVVEPKK